MRSCWEPDEGPESEPGPGPALDPGLGPALASELEPEPESRPESAPQLEPPSESAPEPAREPGSESEPEDTGGLVLGPDSGAGEEQAVTVSTARTQSKWRMERPSRGAAQYSCHNTTRCPALPFLP